ncbi:hypothetical protein V2S66_28720 [Streptomyces sp. V4-01]|uniref:DUF8094 domain-containing protein n=1 Tax=Actinacidiphila polyblastidii TaxID=3110430 RepID=A0ABU7PJC9_9ACTN|nr:hypothetical protein [Streptomyces sp. V4-01]
MIRRRLCLGAAAVALAVPLAGCVTVHGERENVPSVRPAEAARVVAHFTAVNNQATRTYGERYIRQIEAGPLGAIDSAGIRSAHSQHPEGARSSSPLVLSDTRFLIPRQVGWPKFFVADSATNRANGSRWLLLFRRDSAAQPWMADYLAVISPQALPRLATDQDGYLLPVPAAQTGLLVPPGQLSAAYSAYLQSGTDARDFAPGGSTTQLRADRAARARTANSVTQYADQADTAGDFAPAALRTKDGGALVFFGTRHQSRSTYRAGYDLTIDAGTRALMTGAPKTSVTLSHVGQQLVTVPRTAAGGAAAGRVEFVSRLVGLVGAQGA